MVEREYRYRLWLKLQEKYLDLLYINVPGTKKNYFFAYPVDRVKIISQKITIPARRVNTDKGARGVEVVPGTSVGV